MDFGTFPDPADVLERVGGPALVLAGVVLALFLASRLTGFAAEIAIWLVTLVRGPETLYGDEERAADGRVGRFGRARTELAPRGKVFVSGELWDAEADERVPAGERVEVTGLEGLVLRVRPARTRSESRPPEGG
ncbi:MAG: NfeD family protein [Acidobacteriota bacterium]